MDGALEQRRQRYTLALVNQHAIIADHARETSHRFVVAERHAALTVLDVAGQRVSCQHILRQCAKRSNVGIGVIGCVICHVVYVECLRMKSQAIKRYSGLCLTE